MDESKQRYLDKWVKSRALSKVPKIIPPKLLKDKEFVMEALKTLPLKFPLLELCPDTVRKDVEIAKAALKCDVHNMRFIPEATRYKKDAYIVALTESDDSDMLRRAPNKLKDDEDVVRAAIEKEGYRFGDASPRLRDNRELAMIAVTKRPWMFHRASERLRDDKELALIAVADKMGFPHTDGCLLHYCSPRLQDDDEVVRLAVSTNCGLSLCWASPRLQDDKELALIAVGQKREMSIDFLLSKPNEAQFAYKYVSPRLRQDKDVVDAAVKANPYVYRFIPKEFKQDKELAFIATLDLMEEKWLGVPAAFFDDKEWMKRLIAQKAYFFGVASPRLRNDKELLYLALEKRSGYYSAGYALKTDPEVLRHVTRMGMGLVEGSAKFAIRKDGDGYVFSFFFDPKSTARAAAIVRAFSGMADFKDISGDISGVADSMEANVGDQEKTVEIHVDLDYLIDSLNLTDRSSTPSARLYHLSPEILGDKGFWVKALPLCKSLYSSVPENLKNDPDILAAVDKAEA
ncbi:MAG: DUF4116 domain-containing protein [Bacilli bacterium]|nr:DUF4116 domain-containing protein [Bacilli bacterium]